MIRNLLILCFSLALMMGCEKDEKAYPYEYVPNFDHLSPTISTYLYIGGDLITHDEESEFLDLFDEANQKFITGEDGLGPTLRIERINKDSIIHTVEWDGEPPVSVTFSITNLPPVIASYDEDRDVFTQYYAFTYHYSDSGVLDTTPTSDPQIVLDKIYSSRTLPDSTVVTLMQYQVAYRCE